jgi:glycosyltransferase involved in cell wall biosynthesis
MKLAFDSRPAGDPRGIGRYARCLLDALRSTADGNEIVETHRPRDADVFHTPWIDGVRIRCAMPQVVTLHDLVPLKRSGEYLRTGVRFRLRYAAVARADRVIVPTASVAQDAWQLIGVEEERLTIIPEAPAPAFHPRPAEEVEAARRRHGLPDEYLLWVGGLQTPDPRKRVAALAATPRELPLVLAGRATRWAHELPDVIITGHVDDDELAALYTGAHAFVFPSDEEGFGLPPIEALACGTPVVACDVPGVREVLEGRATLVDADDLEGLIEAAQRAERPAPAPPPWTWEDAARATWKVYEGARSSR